ncbi:hypothetical protein [Flavobacterium sp.]
MVVWSRNGIRMVIV